MDSTLKSNLSVGLPLDLLVYETGALRSDQLVCIDEHNPYFQMIRGSWGQKLRQVFESIEDPQWALTRASIDDPEWGLASPGASGTDAQAAAPATTTPLCVRSSRYEPLRKITHPSEKIV
jgi:putative proteasome-type protease